MTRTIFLLTVFLILGCLEGPTGPAGKNGTDGKNGVDASVDWETVKKEPKDITLTLDTYYSLTLPGMMEASPIQLFVGDEFYQGTNKSSFYRQIPYSQSITASQSSISFLKSDVDAYSKNPLGTIYVKAVYLSQQ